MLNIKLVNADDDSEVLFMSEAWRKVFDIRENVYKELCLEIYSTFSFDETIGDDKIMTENSIFFRLGGRKHSMTLARFGVALGLYIEEVV